MNAKVQYLAAACKLSLAATALVGIAFWHDRNTTTTATNPLALTTASVRRFEGVHRHVFVIANSLRQASDHDALLAEDFNQTPSVTYSYFVVTSEAEQARFEASWDAAAAKLAPIGASLDLIDLRSR